MRDDREHKGPGRAMIPKFLHGRSIDDDDTDIPREELMPDTPTQAEMFVDTGEAEVKEREMVTRFLDETASKTADFNSRTILLWASEHIRQGRHLKGDKE